MGFPFVELPYWRTFRRSFYTLVSFYALFHNKETSFVYQGKRGQIADKPQMCRKYLPSPARGRGTAASAVVDEVAKNSMNT